MPGPESSDALDAGAIPDELKALDHWVVWTWVVRAGKRTKPPCDPSTGRPGDATDPRLWLPFARALALLPQFDGVGFALGARDDTPYSGVDLDGCLNQDGSLAPWAAAVVGRLDSYTEVTPSGRGLRVWARGKLPPGRRRRGPLEMYDSGRFFTVSGRHWPGTPRAIRERSAALAALHAEMFRPEAEPSPHRPAPRPLDLSDEEIIRKAEAARNGGAFAALYRGDRAGYPSESEADLALCSRLAFWFGGDVAAIDRVFRRSGLYRPKWEREDYRTRTITKALEGTAFYDPDPPPRPGREPGCDDDREDAPEGPREKRQPPRGECVLVGLDTVVARPVEWLWPDRIPLGKLSLIAGDPGLGKSFLTIALAATVSAGGRWPDRADEPVLPGQVILLSAEDALADTVKPRLEAAGADHTRVKALTTMRLPDGKLSPFSIRRDLPALDDSLGRLVSVRLLVIDPVSAYLGGADEHKNAEIREAIGPLSDLAEKHRVAVVLVTHLNKGNGSKAIYRSTGSLAFVAAARMAWLVVKDRHEPLRRLFLPAKPNLAAEPSGMAFRIADGSIRWEAEPVLMHADDALAAEHERPERNAGDGKRGPVPAKTRAASDWVRNYLAAGPARHGDTRQAAEEAGHATTTFYDALKFLNVERFEVDGKKWLRLPAADAAPDGADPY